MTKLDWEKPTKIKLLRDGKVGLIFIHGLSASTTHMLPLFSYFEKETNYNIIATLLPGHGKKIKDLNNVSWNDWLKEVKNCYEEIRKVSEKVIIIGQSMGGLLALKAAQELNVDGAVLLSSPYDFSRKSKIMLFILKPFIKTIAKEKGIEEYYRKNQLYAYNKWNISATFETFKLLKEVKKILYKITTPVLILQGDEDELIPTFSGKKFLENVSSEKKQFNWIEGGTHLLATGKKNQEVISLISNFLKTL
ncbi:MAG: alpha/beta hydrolase [Candidatus Kariarchaeaceae archaeon]